MHQRGGLAEQIRIGVLTEHAGAGPVHRRLEQSDVAHLDRAAGGDPRDPERLFDRQVAASLAEPAQQVGEPLGAVFGEPVGLLVVLGPQEVLVHRRRATCCMLRPSFSARARSASVCSSVRRRVIAIATRWYQDGTADHPPLRLTVALSIAAGWLRR